MTTDTLHTHLAARVERPPQDGALHVPGVVLAGCAAISLLLLAVHPGGSPQTFAEVLKDEAANQGPDALVHGGFVALLAIQMACFATLAARLGAGRGRVLAALVFTACGSTALAGSMIFDGLVTPAVAAKYLAAPADKLEAARTLISLCGLMVRFLMPMGLAFQAVAALAWSASLLGRGWPARWVAILGAASGVGTLAALAATITEPSPLVLMGGIAAQSLWTAATGALMARGRA